MLEMGTSLPKPDDGGLEPKRRSIPGRCSSEEILVAKATKAGELRSTPWKGGQTTELAIAPAGADYQRRNFSVRVSTASVTSSEPFTLLPGFTRHLMLLKGGGMQLEFKGQSNIKLLGRFNVAKFDGTRAVTGKLLEGEVADFNLMLNSNPGVDAQGMLGAYQLQQGCPLLLGLPYREKVESADRTSRRIALDVIFCLSGQVFLNYGENGTRVILEQGDVFHYERKSPTRRSSARNFDLAIGYSGQEQNAPILAVARATYLPST